MGLLRMLDFSYRVNKHIPWGDKSRIIFSWAIFEHPFVTIISRNFPYQSAAEQTNQQKEKKNVFIWNTSLDSNLSQFSLLQKKAHRHRSTDYIRLPFTKTVDFMRHFEEDISSKPSFCVPSCSSLAFVKITIPIFPHKNPETKTQFRIQNVHKQDMGLV